jgi:hypothetical protein
MASMGWKKWILQWKEGIIQIYQKTKDLTGSSVLPTQLTTENALKN